jgi:hypothetical protein
VIESCEVPIKSIEIQLVRVETCGCAEGFAKDGKRHDIPVQTVWVQLYLFFVLHTNNACLKKGLYSFAIN